MNEPLPLKFVELGYVLSFLSFFEDYLFEREGKCEWRERKKENSQADSPLSTEPNFGGGES